MRFFSRFLPAAALLFLGLAQVSQAQIANDIYQPFPQNLLDNGNFNVNQRAASSVGSITTTAKYLHDRWAVYSGTATTATYTDITTLLPLEFLHAAQVQRNNAQTGVLPVCLVQEIPSSDTQTVAGTQVTLSFWALAGGTFSAASSNLTVKVTTGTGTDEGLATLISGFTGAATPINATQAITTTWTRYATTGTIAATANEIAVQLCFTPTGTAGSSDYFQATGVQLNRGNTALPFEWRSTTVETPKVQRYAFAINELAAGVVQTPIGNTQGTTTTCTVYIPFPNQMRVAPTYTNALTASTFKLVSASQAATALSTPFSATLVANSVSGASMNFTTTGMTAKDGCFIVGAAGSGQMLFSADF